MQHFDGQADYQKLLAWMTSDIVAAEQYCQVHSLP